MLESVHELVKSVESVKHLYISSILNSVLAPKNVYEAGPV